MTNIGMLVLSIWLILTGILSLAGRGGRATGTILMVLALIAGILLLIEHRGVLLQKSNLGILLLALWLLLTGLLRLLHAGSAGMTIMLALLALSAGIMLLVQR